MVRGREVVSIFIMLGKDWQRTDPTFPQRVLDEHRAGQPRVVPKHPYAHKGDTVWAALDRSMLLHRYKDGLELHLFDKGTCDELRRCTSMLRKRGASDAPDCDDALSSDPGDAIACPSDLSFLVTCFREENPSVFRRCLNPRAKRVAGSPDARVQPPR